MTNLIRTAFVIYEYNGYQKYKDIIYVQNAYLNTYYPYRGGISAHFLGLELSILYELAYLSSMLNPQLSI
jgi:hypothetical protein